MSVIDTFWKRQKRQRGDVPDVFTYDQLPQPLRVQVVHILSEAYAIQELGEDFEYTHNAFDWLRRALRKDFGVFNLADRTNSPFDEVANFILQERETEKNLTAIELAFRMVDVFLRVQRHALYNRGTEVDDAIGELNVRFREHGIGYEYASGQINRIDSKLIHAEVVKPALALLQLPKFKGANDEFLSAHLHYREGRFDECLVDCCKALESTLKVICEKRRWKFDSSDPVKKLLAVVIENGLVPRFSETHLTALRTTLESGVPTVRNKLGSHGQGAEIREVPARIASYALHLTATNIVFLVESESEL